MWHLPPTVIEKDLIPKGQEMARRGQSVLVKFHIDAYGGDGKKLDPDKVNWSAATAKGLTYRQQPGPDNPLGFVKVNFNNSHSVYMHDTPSQSIFGRNFRAASSGCVRVHGIEQLATWVLAEQGWRPEHVKAHQGVGRAPRREAEEAGAALFRLHHRLGHRGRRRAVPPRPLPQGRHRRDGRRVLRGASDPPSGTDILAIHSCLSCDRALKVREVIRLIEEDGWVLVATRGSHRQYKHRIRSRDVLQWPGKPADDLAPGTLNSILKQAGLKEK